MCLVFGLNSEKREHLLKTVSGSVKVTIKYIAEASSTPRQTSEMDPFAITFNKFGRVLDLPTVKNAAVERGEYQSSKLTFLAPISQNGQTLSINLSAVFRRYV